MDKILTRLHCLLLSLLASSPSPTRFFCDTRCEPSVSGDFLVDEAVYAELKGSGMFDMLTPKQDEVRNEGLTVDYVAGLTPTTALLQAEHSLEMHLPFIAHLFE